MKWVSRQGSRSLKVAGYSAKEATSMSYYRIMQPVMLCSEAVS